MLLWDESVLEKPESIKLEGLWALRSSKARRLKPIKPGSSHPPAGPAICVPGLHWLALLLLGRQGPATLAAMKWGTTRGAKAPSAREQEVGLLDDCQRQGGRGGLPVFDQGFAGSPWLGLCFQRKLPFTLRWHKGSHRRDAEGSKRRPGRISGRRRSWGQRRVWDARRQPWGKAGLVAIEYARHVLEERFPDGSNGSRRASSPSLSRLLSRSSHGGCCCRAPAKDARPALGSRASRSAVKTRPGKSSVPMHGAGRSRWPGAKARGNWPGRVRASGKGKLASNGC